MITQKITPFLWFDNQAEDAAKFYTSIFKNYTKLDCLKYWIIQRFMFDINHLC